MKPNVKNILIVGTILALLILVLVRLSSRLHTANTLVAQNTQTPSVAESEPPLPFGQITRDEAIKHVEWAYRNGKPYEQVALTKDGPKDYVVTFYQPNPRDENLKTWQEQRGGILVFHIKESKPELIWESRENINLTRPVIEVRDVTGDGNAEILATWSDGKGSILYLYSWNGKDFMYITPVHKVELIGGSDNLYAPSFAIYRGDIQVKDLDGDHIDEVILLGGVILDKDENEQPNPNPTATIFKWDGKKYYIWKLSTPVDAELERKIYK